MLTPKSTCPLVFLLDRNKAKT